MKLNHAQWVEVLCVLMEAEAQPAATIETIRAAASAGADSDIRDTLHHGLFAARFYPAAVRTKLEELLQAKGLPPLSRLDAGFRDTCGRVLKRGRIRSDEEFYVVAEILGGPDFDELSSDDQRRLGEISYAYERKRAKA
jgi:hypothetical protein